MLRATGWSAPEVLFTDDSAAKLAGAEQLGMETHHYRGLAGLRVALARHGVVVDSEGGAGTPCGPDHDL